MSSSRVTPLDKIPQTPPPLHLTSWDEDFLFDAASRGAIKESFNLSCDSSIDETKALDIADNMLSLLDNKTLPTTAFQTSSSILSAATCTHVEGGHTITFGLSRCVLRATSADILAFTVDNTSRF